jgi:hypothetical protein
MRRDETSTTGDEDVLRDIVSLSMSGFDFLRGAHGGVEGELIVML